MTEVVKLIAFEAVNMVGEGVIVAIIGVANGARDIEVDPYRDVTDVAVESNAGMAPIDKEADQAAVVGDGINLVGNRRRHTKCGRKI